MKYQALPAAPTKSEAEAILIGSDVTRICEALLSLAEEEPDKRWVEERCLIALEHRDSKVRAVAATSVGHLARLRHNLDLVRLLPQLAKLLADPATAGFAQIAMDDIRIFHPTSPQSE